MADRRMHYCGMVLTCLGGLARPNRAAASKSGRNNDTDVRRTRYGQSFFTLLEALRSSHLKLCLARWDQAVEAWRPEQRCNNFSCDGPYALMNGKIHLCAATKLPSAMSYNSLSIARKTCFTPFWPMVMVYTAPLNFSARIMVFKFQEFAHLRGFAWPWET
jgi:hypothetical protein